MEHFSVTALHGNVKETPVDYEIIAYSTTH